MPSPLTFSFSSQDGVCFEYNIDVDNNPKLDKQSKRTAEESNKEKLGESNLEEGVNVKFPAEVQVTTMETVKHTDTFFQG